MCYAAWNVQKEAGVKKLQGYGKIVNADAMAGREFDVTLMEYKPSIGTWVTARSARWDASSAVSGGYDPTLANQGGAFYRGSLPTPLCTSVGGTRNYRVDIRVLLNGSINDIIQGDNSYAFGLDCA